MSPTSSSNPHGYSGVIAYSENAATPDLVAAMMTEKVGIERAFRRGTLPTEPRVMKLKVGAQSGTAWAASLEGRPVPPALVSMGFACGLQESCKLGHVMLSQTFLAESETEAFHSDPCLLGIAAQACQQAGIQYHMGPSLTVLKPALKSTEKQSFGIQTGALSCDMDDYWLAKEAKKAGVPFLSARVVLDVMSQDLPAVIGKLAFAEGLSKAFLLLSQVWHLPLLVHLSFQSAHARKCLGTLAAALCSRLLPMPIPQSTLSAGSAF